MEKNEINNLITKIGNGDEEAMECLYNGIGKAVYSFIFSIVKEKNSAEDVMQETFLKLFTHPKVMTEKDNGLAYILTIARNKSLNYIKKNSRQIPTDDDILQKGVKQGDMVENAEIKAFLNTLTEEEKRVLILKELYGFTYEEIRKVLHLSIATVKRRMESVREKSKYFKILWYKTKLTTVY